MFPKNRYKIVLFKISNHVLTKKNNNNITIISQQTNKKSVPYSKKENNTESDITTTKHLTKRRIGQLNIICLKKHLRIILISLEVCRNNKTSILIFNTDLIFSFLRTYSLKISSNIINVTKILQKTFHSPLDKVDFGIFPKNR